VKALLFDMDGTLADTEPFHIEALRRVVGAHGVALDVTRFHARYSGLASIEVARQLFPAAKPAHLQAIVREKERLFRELAHEVRPMPGLKALLDGAASGGLRLALVTNAPRLNIRFLLRHLGLEDVFDTVVSAATLPRSKPHPLPYRTALDRLGVPPDQAIAFEDSVAGVRSSVAAGVRCIGITSTARAEALIDAGAAKTIPDFLKGLPGLAIPAG